MSAEAHEDALDEGHEGGDHAPVEHETSRGSGTRPRNELRRITMESHESKIFIYSKQAKKNRFHLHGNWSVWYCTVNCTTRHVG